VNEEKKVAKRKDRREGIAVGLRPHHNFGGRKPPTYRKKHPLPVKTTRFIYRISWIACAVTWLRRASQYGISRIRFTKYIFS
jgi:hypothetical protein